jgi:heptosyltransferase III
MRTLMVHSGGIGDFLLTCPAIEQLAKQGPITLAGHRDRLQLAVVGGLAVHAWSLDQIRFDSLFSTPHPELVEVLANFERVIVWMRDDDGHIERTLKNISTAEIHVHAGLPPNDWNKHATDYFLEALGLAHQIDFRLSIQASPIPKDIIIHPGSGGVEKNWPLENFIVLANSLKASGRRVTWSLGPAERERMTTDLSGDTLSPDSLSELAPQLAAAQLYISNDSGITHLAAALGTPTLALFGPTNSNVWAPKGKHVIVLHQWPNWVTPEQVLEAIN